MAFPMEKPIQLQRGFPGNFHPGHGADGQELSLGKVF